MLDMRIHCYLVRVAQLGQDIFALATLLGREEIIRRYEKSVSIFLAEHSIIQLTCGRNAQWALNTFQLIHLHMGGMGHIAYVQQTGFEVTSDVLAPIAVSNPSNALTALFLAHVSNGSVNDWVCHGREVVLQPGHDVEIPLALDGDRIAMKQVGQDHEVAIGGKLVGNQLGINQFGAEDVGEK